MATRTFQATGLWSDTTKWAGGVKPSGSETWHINTGQVCTMDASPGALSGAGDIDGTLNITGQGTGTLGAITINSGGNLSIAGITAGGTIGNITDNAGPTGSFVIGTSVGVIGTITLNNASVLTINGFTGTTGTISVLTASTLTVTSTFAGTLGAPTITGSGSSAQFTNTAGAVGNITLNTSAALTFTGTAITTVFGTITVNTSSTVYQNAIFTTGYTGSWTIASTGTLYAGRAAINFLRVTGTITSAGVAPAGINYGTAIDAIPIAYAAFIEFVCTSDNQTSRGIVCSNDNACTFYGAARTMQSTLASVANLNDGTIVLADDLALRPTTGGNPWDGVADMIVVGMEPILTTITGASNASPIMITTSNAHGLANGNTVVISGVGGNTAANGSWTVANVTTYTFTLTSSVGNGAWVSGGSYTRLGVGVGTENYHLENYAVAGYVAGTKTVTLGDAGVGQSDWARAATPYNQIKKVARPIGTPVYVMSYNVGIRGSAYNLRPAIGISCGSHIQSIVNTSIWWCYNGINNNYGTCTTCNSVGCSYGIVNNYGTCTTCNSVGCSYGINANYGTCTTCNPVGCTNGINANYGTCTTCNPVGCTNGINANSGTCTTCNSVGCSYGIAYNYGTCTTCNPVGCTNGIAYNSGATLINCDLSSNTNGLNFSQWGTLQNCKFPSLLFTNYNNAYYRVKGQYLDSWDHNQVAGAFKAWCLGGIVTKAANVMPVGKTYSYEHACESALYPVFRQLEYTMKRYEKLHYRTWVRKNASMTYLPRIQIVDKFIDPLVSSGADVNGVPLYANAALAETLMTNSVDTWELIDVYYFNDSNMPKKVILRTLAMNSTGIVYFYPSVILRSDEIVTCDSEGTV